MTVIIKVNSIQKRPFQGSQKVRYGRRGTKKACVGVREMKLGKRFENV